MMRLALTNLYRARWTDRIYDEWTRNVVKQRPDMELEAVRCIPVQFNQLRRSD